jgi:peptidoglycan/LPS O-acetylase OafA/YrhL
MPTITPRQQGQALGGTIAPPVDERLPEDRVKATVAPSRSGWTRRILSGLSRITSSGAFIPEVDGLRFIAITWVMLHHIRAQTLTMLPPKQASLAAGSVLGSFMEAGSVGVPLFFVISGFILALPFAKRHLSGQTPPGLLRYYTRRLTRLEPPFILSVLFMCAFVLVRSPVLHPDRPISEVMQTIAVRGPTSLAYMHSLVYGQASWVNCVLWSLEVEVQFYCLAPLLARVFTLRDIRVRRTVLLCAIVAFSLFSRYVVTTDWPRMRLSVLNYMQFFAVGFLLVDLYLNEWSGGLRRKARWDLVGLGAWGLIPVLHLAPRYSALLPLAVLAAYVCAFRGRFFGAFLRNPWIVVIGGMCYTIYLYHYTMVVVLSRFTMKLSAGQSGWQAIATQAAVMTPLILVPSAVAFALFERPFMRRDWLTKLIARLRGA